MFGIVNYVYCYNLFQGVNKLRIEQLQVEILADQIFSLKFLM